MVETHASDRMPPEEPGRRMQRLRVGITGLAAVLLLVTLATAIASGVRHRAEATNAIAPPPVVATLPSSGPPMGNGTAPNTDPLAQLGAAPGGNPDAASQHPPAKH